MNGVMCGTETEGAGWRLDWSTEDVGHQTEPLHTEQQAACESLDSSLI